MAEGEFTPVWIGRDEAEREFAETLRQAAWIFENEKDGRFHGSIFACRAVARFIYLRNGGAELAGPFLQIAEAFKDLERGGKPRLFSKKTAAGHERARSPERKHIQMLANVAVEVLHRLGDQVEVATDDKPSAATRVADHVSSWPGMGVQNVTATTIINWRKKMRRSPKFEDLVEKTLAEPNPRGAIMNLLRNGPHGHFRG